MPQIVRFVGIDVAMDRLDVHIHPSGTAFAVPNSAAGVRQLIGRIERGSVIALEASGGYERIAAEGLAEAGLSVFCLHPADVRAFARLAGKRAKTDKIDARLIARAAQVAADAGRKPYQARPAAAKIKEMAACRRLLHGQLAALKGQATRLATPPMQTLMARQIASLKADIQRIDQAMAQTIEDDPALHKTARRIQTAPGAGPVLAATLAAYLPELGNLSSRQAASLTGVAPHPRQSGNSRPKGRCQGGRAPLRAVLYMATLAAIRTKNSPLKTFFERLRQNGKPFKLAIVAAMRKFIVTLNAMIKNQKDWETKKPKHSCSPRPSPRGGEGGAPRGAEGEGAAPFQSVAQDIAARRITARARATSGGE